MRVRALVFAIVAALLAAPMVRASDTLDLAALRARITAANGAQPADYRDTVSATTSATTSTLVTVRRGSNYRLTRISGPIHAERGFVDGEAWHQDPNGLTVFDEPDGENPVRASAPATIRLEREPAHAYVVSRLDAAGYGTREYIDATTYRTLRLERRSPNDDVVTEYDDFRRVGSLTIPFHWHTRHLGFDFATDYRRTSFVAGSVTDADLAKPSIRRALVAFPAQSKRIDLPARFAGGHIIVRVDIGGRGLDFVLDSGSAEMVIDESVAKDVRLERFTADATTDVDRYPTENTIVPALRIGRLEMRDIVFRTAPAGVRESADVKAVGLLGFDFLATLGVTIDYEHQRVTVVPAQSYAPPPGKLVPLDVRLGANVPMTTVALNGAIGERFVIDTGGYGPFEVFDTFAARHPEAIVDHNGIGAHAGTPNIRGLSATVGMRPYAVADLRVSDLDFKDVVGYRVTSRLNFAQPVDGLIGPDFLRLFNVGLDYADSRVYLSPYASGRNLMAIPR